MKTWFENKSIAVVGNASSLLDKEYGKQIDSHDVVIRMNRGLTAMTNASMHKSHGIRTDVWIMNLYLSLRDFHTRYVTDFGLKPTYLKMQMNPVKLKSPRERNQYLILTKELDSWYPEEYSNQLLRKFKPKYPTTGLRILDYLLKCSPKFVGVFGFDWKETPTFYNKHVPGDTEHDFDRERNYCQKEFFSRKDFVLYK